MTVGSRRQQTPCAAPDEWRSSSPARSPVQKRTPQRELDDTSHAPPDPSSRNGNQRSCRQIVRLGFAISHVEVAPSHQFTKSERAATSAQG